ncbi:MAG: fructose-6-phosphate aldolase [Firmicutes bacterium]|jgi:fructose-6-phosphate aldolase 2|nr:transaldolase family protein [Bacillota bacterium]NLL88927.1 fructose-6-phosphate aldolase [Bacillota bacterium]HKM18325.1 transaldolase family protein [Limnochordia bacterium]
MIYMLDTTNIPEIERLFDLYPIDGVTTNPSIIAQEQKPLRRLLRDIRSVIGEEALLHVQPISTKAEDIVHEALEYRDLCRGNYYAKIPVTPQGIKAIQLLKQRGVKVTATAIFTQQQALIAAKAGADFVAPYVNRLDNISSDGIGVVADIMTFINAYDMRTQVLAASFKNVEQVHRVCLLGAHSVTIAPELFESLLYHPLTDRAVWDFYHDGVPYYDEPEIIEHNTEKTE